MRILSACYYLVGICICFHYLSFFFAATIYWVLVNHTLSYTTAQFCVSVGWDLGVMAHANATVTLPEIKVATKQRFHNIHCCLHPEPPPSWILTLGQVRLRTQDYLRLLRFTQRRSCYGSLWHHRLFLIKHGKPRPGTHCFYKLSRATHDE